ncbi:MMPL family transporter [Microbacterium sp. A8/3-1]|uniref:MMPL family transporter n=1 Tax=Microbacterium sp. A8/3-1 TaxID=3160749 RepID=A0AAU7W2E3_9MICO
MGTIEALSLSRFAAAGSESDRAARLLADQSGTGSPNVALMVIPQEGSVDDADVAAEGSRLTERLGSWPGVTESWSYWTESASMLRAEDGSAAWVLAYVPGDADRVRSEILPGLVEEFTVSDGPVRVVVAGADEVFREVAEQSRSDFLRAELIILPLVLLLLWAIYRRFRVALLTLVLGFFAVFGSLAILRGVTAFAEVSTFASNIVLVLGIGLGVDYGLFMIFRYREELRRTDSIPDAIAATLRGAGRTVFFSGLTVAAALAVLFVFPYPFLSSFAYAGIAVVVVAVAAALIVLPAALAVLGTRVLPRRPRKRPLESGIWYRVPAAVMRHPVLLGGAGLIVVLALAAPVVGVAFGVADDRVLPATAPVRDAYNLEREVFAGQDSDALLIVSDQKVTDDDLGSYAAALSRVEGALRVDTREGSYVDGAPVDGNPSARFNMSDPGTWLSVIPSSAALNSDVAGLVRDVRAVDAPADVLVGGYPAELVDYRDGVTSYLPAVAVLIVLLTFIVLFLMTGSVVVPLQVSALNLLSMAVMFAVLVWGFQNGGLAWLTGFTPTGSIEPSIPILMFCIAYGLSMDYSVFLVARIKEEHDRTGDSFGSVPLGIAKSGPLVTAAAVTLAASFLVYATGQVVFLQQLVIGMAVAVLVDATLVRAILLPALFRASGTATWWAPKPLRALHARFGLSES